MGSQAECVVLLHGLGRTHRSMAPMQSALQARGYRVENVRYASVRTNIETLAVQVVGSALDKCQASDKVHFVTHSLGGILFRQYLSQHKIPNLGRVVMLGPPNKGSEVVDRLRNFALFYYLNGEAGLQLGAGADSVPNRLGRADFDLGIIAGTRSINPWLSTMIAGTNDGKVSVESTRLEGMHDHLEMAVAHPFLMRNKRVIAQVIYYLQHGRFAREDKVS